MEELEDACTCGCLKRLAPLFCALNYFKEISGVKQ